MKFFLLNFFLKKSKRKVKAKDAILHFLGQRNEGLRWRPRHSETMKGAEASDMLRGAGNKHRSEDSRIGQPPKELLFEFIEKEEATW